MVITFYGAAGTVTGSKHLITLKNGQRILLDCGMVQGKGSDNSNKSFHFDPKSVDCMILSHAHIDHSGLIPLLVKKGFKGPIYSTQPTFELVDLLLYDSAKIQSNDSDGPLYDDRDVANALKLFYKVKYGETVKIGEDVFLTFSDAGHILGSAAIHLAFKESRRNSSLCFTGDLGRYSNRILCPPGDPKSSDIVICESTYGDSLHQSIESTEGLLEDIITEVCINRKGKLLIPAFSIGRTQELIFSINKMVEEGKFAHIPVFVDSPLSFYATEVIRNHPECFNESMRDYIKTDPDPFGFPKLRYIQKHEESMQLLKIQDPAIIISSSGMMDAGRIQYHLKEHLSNPDNGILITGYSAPGTLGHQIISGEKEVFIHDEKVAVNAELFFLKEYSAHADYGDILKFLSQMDKDKIKHIFLVHGEKKTMGALKEQLSKEGFKGVELAEFRISYEL